MAHVDAKAKMRSPITESQAPREREQLYIEGLVSIDITVVVAIAIAIVVIVMSEFCGEL